jgi:hypothetical protein
MAAPPGREAGGTMPNRIEESRSGWGMGPTLAMRGTQFNALKSELVGRHRRLNVDD